MPISSVTKPRNIRACNLKTNLFSIWLHQHYRIQTFNTTISNIHQKKHTHLKRFFIFSQVCIPVLSSWEVLKMFLLTLGMSSPLQTQSLVAGNQSWRICEQKNKDVQLHSFIHSFFNNRSTLIRVKVDLEHILATQRGHKAIKRIYSWDASPSQAHLNTHSYLGTTAYPHINLQGFVFFFPFFM